MKERTFSNENYRYGFNGQEQSDELDENGNSYTAEYWQYDARLGRRWNVDPVVVEWESGYATFRNSPIILNDPDGDCPSCNWAIRQGFLNYAIGQIIPEIVINENGHVTGTTWQYAGNYQWVNVTNNKTGYVYTHADLVQRARIMALPTSMGFINPIKTELWSREDDGLFHPITTNGFYRQYVARWGTNSAFWFGAENYMTELWDGGGFGSAIASSARRVRASMGYRSISISPNSGGSLGGGGSFKSIDGKYSISDLELRGEVSDGSYLIMPKSDLYRPREFIGFTAHKDPDFPIDIAIHGREQGDGFSLAVSRISGKVQHATFSPESFGNYLELQFGGQNLRIFSCHSTLNMIRMGKYYSGNIKYADSMHEIFLGRARPRTSPDTFYVGDDHGLYIPMGDFNNTRWKTTK